MSPLQAALQHIESLSDREKAFNGKHADRIRALERAIRNLEKKTGISCKDGVTIRIPWKLFGFQIPFFFNYYHVVVGISGVIDLYQITIRGKRYIHPHGDLGKQIIYEIVGEVD